jgi:hypothetical protein
MYPFDPVEVIFPESRNYTSNGRVTLAQTLGVDTAVILRYRQNGLDSSQADAVAITLGLHPAALWPSWFDDADLERCVWCATPVPPTRRFCGKPCSQSARVEARDVNRLGCTHSRRRKWWARLERYRREYVEPEAGDEMGKAA